MPGLTVTIPPTVGVWSLGQSADELLAAMATSAVVRLDASAIPASDPSVMLLAGQLIVAARRHAADLGIDFTLAKPVTAPFASVLERAGITPATPDDLRFWHGDMQQ